MEVLEELFGAEVLEAKAAKKLSERERYLLVLAAGNLFDTDSGKDLLWWLFNETGVFRLSFTGGSETFFREGKRAVGLELWTLLLEARPNALAVLMEHKRLRLEE